MHRALIIEFLGTLFFVFVIFATKNYIAIGAILALLVLLGGPISGGYYNPAVAIANMLAGNLGNHMVIPYILAEVFGGICGFFLYKKIF